MASSLPALAEVLPLEKFPCSGRIETGPAAQEGTRFRDGIKWARGWPRPVKYTYQLNCNSLYFTTNGTWTWIRPRRDTAAVGVPGNHGYSEMQSSTTGDYKELSHIRVKKYGLRAQTGPDRGIVEIKVNGVFVANVDLYSASYVAHVLVWESSDLNGSNNTVRATVTGTKNASSSSVMVALNTIEITYAP